MEWDLFDYLKAILLLMGILLALIRRRQIARLFEGLISNTESYNYKGKSVADITKEVDEIFEEVLGR